MADGMCGPSNALQSLQKQTSVDLTLHQDRLLSSTSPSQGFRSPPGPSSRFLEAEFEAFQNTSLPPEQVLTPQATSETISHRQQLPLSNWVSDFNQLNLSADISLLVQQNVSLSENLHLQKNIDDWHLEFDSQRMKNGSIERSSNLNARSSEKNNIPYMGNTNRILNIGQVTTLEPYHSLGDIYDQKAFVEAFDQTAELEKDVIQDISKQSSQQNQERLSMSNLTNKDGLLTMQDEVHLTQNRIGADAIALEKVSEEDNSNLLSLTASRLLAGVQDEQTSKFQNSRFLDLMRRFRDKEATIQGDQVIGKTYDPGY